MEYCLNIIEENNNPLYYTATESHKIVTFIRIVLVALDLKTQYRGKKLEMYVVIKAEFFLDSFSYEYYLLCLITFHDGKHLSI